MVTALIRAGAHARTSLRPHPRERAHANEAGFVRAAARLLAMLLISSVPLETMVEDPTLGSTSRVIGALTATVWALSIAIRGHARRPGAIHVAMILFVGWCAASVLWSGNPERTAEHLVTWTQLLLMAYILWDVLDSPAALATGMQMYVLGAYVAIASTVSNYLSGNTYYYERFSATGTNPDDVGALLALGIPIACYLFAYPGRRGIVRWLKWLNFAYVPAALLGIALSGTRTALIAAAPGLAFGLWSLRRMRPAATIAVVLLLAAAGLTLRAVVPEASLRRLGTTLGEMSEGDLNGRVTLWREGIAAFTDQPLLGVGSNMYRSVNAEGKVAHNSFVSVLVQLGLVGFALFAVILSVAGAAALRQPSAEARLWIAVLAAWTIAASTLTWEDRKPTWLFLTAVAIGASTSGLQRPSLDSDGE